MGFAWYKKLKPKNLESGDCDCEKYERVSFIQSKLFLMIVTIIATTLILFPYYSNIFFHSSNGETIIIERENLAIAQLNIVGMTCSGCEESVNGSIKKLPGVLEVTSNHKSGIVKIKYDKSLLRNKKLYTNY